MTNKPMLSVERELLEDMLNPCADFATHERLRALLDAPVGRVEVIPANNAEQALTLLDFALSFALCNMDLGSTQRKVKRAQAHLESYRKFKAARCQGEPVAELQVAFFEHGPMATINWFTPSAFESGATKLYAEQPAPVAVMMPERLNTDEGYSVEASIWYNMALEDVAKLNGVKP